MKYFALDLETTGLDEDTHQIIEIGGVIDDLQNPEPLDDLPEFHCYVTHDVYNVSEYCLGLHSDTGIFESLSNRKDEFIYLEPNQIAYRLGKFIYREYLDREERYGEPGVGDFVGWTELFDTVIDKKSPRNFVPTDDFFPMQVVPAGKNFGGLDQNFLDTVPNLNDIIRLHHRVLDPGPMYARPDDGEVPNLQICLDRAGINDEVPHHAVADSKLVVKLIRNHYDIEF